MECKGSGSVLMKRFELGRLLGQGTFAKVYYARNLKTGMIVAIKIIDKEKILKCSMTDHIKREISVMRLLRHPNIVQLYEVMASKTKIYFILEYVKGGELFDKVSKGKVKEDVARKYFQQLICAVDFCHSRGVYHRDLKPENLLLDENGNLKVSDFGLSALSECKRRDGLLHTLCGTPTYVAPEVINQRGYNGAKADIWSCGVILYVLMTGNVPFHDPNLMELYKMIDKAEIKFPKWVSPEVKRLISRMLDPNPSTRIHISKIMETRWFQKGFESKPVGIEMEGKVPNCLDFDEVFGTEAESKKQEIAQVNKLNAFDIISLSAGFDLSSLFEDKDRKKQIRFTSRHTADTILSKFENLAKILKLKATKKDGGLLKLEGSNRGRKGILAINAEVFEVTPSFHFVEVKKCSGDTLEYLKMMKNDIRPALKDIVWTWQDDVVATQIPEEDNQEPKFTQILPSRSVSI